MVKRVIGKANGFDIIFERGEGNWWNITIPSDLSGEYVVEICAEDEAGNIDFLCRMMFAICGHELQVRLLDGSFSGSVVTGSLCGILDDITKKYTAELQKGGYCCERTICSRDVH